MRKPFGFQPSVSALCFLEPLIKEENLISSLQTTGNIYTWVNHFEPSILLSKIKIPFDPSSKTNLTYVISHSRHNEYLNLDLASKGPRISSMSREGFSTTDPFLFSHILPARPTIYIHTHIAMAWTMPAIGHGRMQVENTGWIASVTGWTGARKPEKKKGEEVFSFGFTWHHAFAPI